MATHHCPTHMGNLTLIYPPPTPQPHSPGPRGRTFRVVWRGAQGKGLQIADDLRLLDVYSDLPTERISLK